MAVRIAGTGCCLMDILYPRVDFSSAAFSRMRSVRDGDGGLVPGRLVFAEDAARFARSSALRDGRTLHAFQDVVAELAGGAEPDAENIGGPSIVALIHAAQMLEGTEARVSFFGSRGEDALGDRIEEKLRALPVELSGFRKVPGATPSTRVLSDPAWDSGRGERCFVNEIGAAAEFFPSDLGEDFFHSDIVAFGGTGLVPALHDGLPELLEAARSSGALTVVNTVFDFRAERKDPEGPWPLGGRLDLPGVPGPARSYSNCDLLVMDRDEAVRLSGRNNLGSALEFFVESGVGAFLVTQGGDPVLAWSSGGAFKPLELLALPVSELALDLLKARPRCGDTTGCGDNFVGGVLADLAEQKKEGGVLDLVRAASWGIAGGAFTLSILGGTYVEKYPGEKRELVTRYHEEWLSQTGRENA